MPSKINFICKRKRTSRIGFGAFTEGSRPVSRTGAVIEAIKYRRLSRYKIRKIILYFTGDITASFVSKILHINRKTINAYYNEIREKILHHSLQEREKELGEFELDENCFGARGVCGKRGQGVADNQRLQSLPSFPSWNEFACGKSYVNGIGCF